MVGRPLVAQEVAGRLRSQPPRVVGHQRAVDPAAEHQGEGEGVRHPALDRGGEHGVQLRHRWDGGRRDLREHRWER